MCKVISEKRNFDNEYYWLNNIQLSTIREAVRECDYAFNSFFSKRTRFPKFKSKKRSKKFFSTRSERTTIKDDYIYIPELGLVYASNHRIPCVRLYNTGVEFDGYRYWFHCQILKEINTDNIKKSDNIIGIDVGIRNMITTSDGNYYHLPDNRKLYKKLKRQDRRLQKHYKKYLNISMHTKTKYEDIQKSKNMMKLLNHQHNTIEKIKNRTRNSINCATKEIVSQLPNTIVIENISVSDQVKNNKKWIRKYMPNMIFYEIHRQLIYKSEDRGIKVLKVPKDFPSTKMCSSCGNIHELYGNKIFICNKCGLRIDRDLNAALNLKNFAYL